MIQNSLTLRDRPKPLTFRFQRISAGSVGSGAPFDLLAYINNISDSSSPEWDERLDIGRADPKILYRSFNRTISLSFNVVVESDSNPGKNLSQQELDNELNSRSAGPGLGNRDSGFQKSPILSGPNSMADFTNARLANVTYDPQNSRRTIAYTKNILNKLSKLSLPVYNGPYVGSYVKFSIGKLYTNEMGYIKSINFEWDNSTIVWDEAEEFPMITAVSMEIGYIGKRKPQVASNFFG
jgi:hypothetical protein